MAVSGRNPCHIPIEQAMLPAHRWLDQHVFAKLTLLLVMALACCGALWYAQIVIPYHNQRMLIAGIIAIALIYVSASIAALLGWRKLRISEQSDIVIMNTNDGIVIVYSDRRHEEDKHGEA